MKTAITNHSESDPPAMEFPPPSSSLILLSASLLLVLLPHSTITAQKNIPVGAPLTAAADSDLWRSSPNGDFAFGFQQLKPNNTTHFVLSIWLDKIPSKTIVWYERTSYPVPRGSTLRLDATAGLVLSDPQGRLLYNSNVGGQVGYAFMNDTGNLIIAGSDSSILWESFRNPTDTLLPAQTLEIGDKLVSRKADADFAPGRFTAYINDAGDFVLETKSVLTNLGYDDEYYSSRTSSENASDAGVRVVFTNGSLISVARRSGDEQILSPRSIPPPSENYYRVVLEFDGVLRLYYHPKISRNDARWVVAGFWPENICMNIDGRMGSGACGYNSICRIENERPVCECPVGFSLADPSNPYGDCNPKFVQTCTDGASLDEYGLEVVYDTDWPFNDYEQINPSTEDQCRSACLSDCVCGVAIYRSNSCWKKKLPLSNGRVDTNLGVKAFLKMRKGDLPTPSLDPPATARRDSSRRRLIVVLLGSSAFINFLLITAACLLLYFIYKKKLAPQINRVRESNLRCFTYKELEHATDGFKEELGRGAFGIVYKGAINGDDGKVAVKKLERMFQDSEKEFKTEVNVIGRTHHKNLVSMIGFCDEGPHRMLVYEYMSNGTLAAFLFGDTRPSWSHRTQIAVGIAKGLTYLHEECSSQIIHCDIKPQNILLDDYYTARISDFGLAKLLVMNQSKTLTAIRGTKGYVAPEWFRNTQISAKVDVYSFGVVLLEIISCRKALNNLESEEGENPVLTDWAWDCFAEGRVEELVRNDEAALREREMVERFIKVGLWCIQEDATLRPTMIGACQMLQGVVEVPEPPALSTFYSVV